MRIIRLRVRIAAYQLAAAFGPVWQARAIPVPAESLDQQDRVRHPPSQDVNRRDFIPKGDTLRGDHLEVTGDAALVPCR